MSLFAILALVVAGTTASAAPPVNDVVSNPAKVVSKTAKNEIISIAPKVQLADDSDGRELAQPAYLMDSGELYVPTGAAPAPFLPAPRGPFSLTTLPNFAGGNSGNPGGGASFDLTVGASDVLITGMDVNTLAVLGTPIDISVYTHNLGAINVSPWVCPSPGDPECVAANWTLVASGTGVSAGSGFPSPTTFAVPFTLLAGTKTGITISLSGGVNLTAAHSYTNGTGANQTVGDAFITLDLGTAHNFLFLCPVFCPRVWNGTIHYLPSGVTGACCTGGVCAEPVDPVACVNGGGVFLGVGSTCTPANICEIGACCMTDGSCSDLTIADCTTAGGAHQGPVTNCATTSCPQPGACCDMLANCTMAVLVGGPGCAGTYLGDDTSCTPNPCVLPGVVNVGPHSSLYVGFTRGFSYTSPVDHIITDLSLPADAFIAGATASYLVGVSSDGGVTWVDAHYSTLNAGGVVVSIQVVLGDEVRIMGNWTSGTPTNFSARNSYNSTSPFATTILGVPVDLFRSGFQWDIADLTNPAITSGGGFGGLAGAHGRIFMLTAAPGPARCCDLLGACSILDPAACAAIGGNWTGGADCTAACPQPGACCNSNGTGCEDNVLQANCAGDRWEGGVLCPAMSPPCAEDLGACCLTSGCQEGVTGNACFGMGGVWLLGTCAGVLCEDNCATPRTLVDGVISNFDTTGATTDGPGPDENSCTAPANTFIGTNDIWFRYSPPFDGALTVTLCGSSYDSTLQVYSTIDPMTGLPAPMTCADLPPNVNTTEVCDDDGCGVVGGASIVAGINALAGQEYLIRVGGWGGPAGNPTGPGTILASVFAINTGACCRLDGTCTIEPVANCLFPEAYFEQQPCGVATCGEIGACCSNMGCAVTFANTCAFLGGTFLGVASDCGPGGPGNPPGCAGGINGTSDFCAIASGLADDCDGDGVPDNCTIVLCPFGDPSCSDCDFNGKLDRCDIRCCVSDLTLNASVQGPDIQQIVDGIVNPPTPACWDATLCGLDANKDGAIDTGDIPDHVANLLDGACLGLLTFYTSHSIPGGVGGMNAVFIWDEAGNNTASFPEIAGAVSDVWGYRDGASDGNRIFFGWGAGLASHALDGTGGTLEIAGAAPGGVGTWRALAFDPTGNGGAGSFWTASFGSALIEVSRAGALLNTYPAPVPAWALYGLAYDSTTGRLWGHSQSSQINPTGESVIWEIETTGAGAGTPTGVFLDMKTSVGTGFITTAGGMSADPGVAGAYFVVGQGAPDEAYDIVIGGTPPAIQLNPNSLLTTNPIDLDAVTGNVGGLGVAAVRQ